MSAHAYVKPDNPPLNMCQECGEPPDAPAHRNPDLDLVMQLTEGHPGAVDFALHLRLEDGWEEEARALIDKGITGGKLYSAARRYAITNIDALPGISFREAAREMALGA